MHMQGRTACASAAVSVDKQTSKPGNKLIVTLHVGTHGSCVRSNGLFIARLLPACQPVCSAHLFTYFAGADARAVRPYISIVAISPCNPAYIAR